MKIRTVIVEDEILGQEVITGILKNYCGESVEVVGVSATVQKSIDIINATQPHLVFLDIKLGSNDQGAFDILYGLEEINFKIIFTTSSQLSDHLLKAINDFGAKKYLLKPLDIDEVVEAVALVKEEINASTSSIEIEDIRKILNGIHTSDNLSRLKLPVKNGFQYIPHEEIVMLRSNLNSTLVFLCNNQSVATSKNLKYLAALLPKQQFIRVSKSYIVNVAHVEKISNEDGGTIFLKNECTATLSNNYRDRFFTALDG